MSDVSNPNPAPKILTSNSEFWAALSPDAGCGAGDDVDVGLRSSGSGRDPVGSFGSGGVGRETVCDPRTLVMRDPRIVSMLHDL